MRLRHELGADRIAVLAQRRHRTVTPGRAVAARGRGGIGQRAHRCRDLDAAQMRRGGWPPSYCISGTAIQSAMASNMEIEIVAPSPDFSRAISASRIAS